MPFLFPTTTALIILLQHTSATTTCDCSTSCPALGTIIDTNIMCQAYESCIGLDLDATNNIWCYGNRGCTSTVLTITSAGVPASGIQCSGQSSCSYSEIKHPNSVISLTSCDGWRACHQAEIEIENGNQVDCGGYEGCQQATIESHGDIYCNGFEGCRLTTINAYLQSSPDIYCDGKRSCWGINIISANVIYCNGYQSCFETAFSTIDAIYGYGNEALKDSTIDSNGFSQIDVRLRGLDAGDGLVITCWDGVDCQIFCDAFGCKGTTIKHCDSGDVTISGTFSTAELCKLSMFQNKYMSERVWCPTLKKMNVSDGCPAAR